MEFFENSPFLQFISVWAPLAGFIWWFFDKFEDTISKEKKSALVKWLKNQEKVDRNWPEMFIDLFDRLFGKRPFAWKFFFRSCLASIIALAIVTTMYWPRLDLHFSEASFFLFIIGGASLVINLIPDYISLTETRFILKAMKNRGLFIVILLATVDFVVSGLIIMFAIWASFAILSGELASINETVELVTDSASFVPIFIITSYFTSIWVWLFLAASLLIKSLNALSIGRASILNLFNINEKPIKSLGVVSVLAMTLVVGLSIVLGN